MGFMLFVGEFRTFYTSYDETPTKGCAMSQDNMIAFILAACCGALAAAFGTEYIVAKLRKFTHRIKH